jgi:hypothetical protein
MQFAHVVVRPDGWVLEWRWAVYQYQFSTVLLAPVVAGAAAVLGRRWALARPQLATGARGGLGFLAGLAPLAVLVAGVHLVGFVVVVVRAEAVGAPSVADLVPFVPALAQLVVVLALGYVAGWVTRSWLAAPLVAVTVFGLLLGAWLTGRTPLVQVGGATSSLVGLVVDDGVMAGQVTAYLALAGALLAGTVAHLRRQVPVVPLAAAAVGVLAIVGLTRHPGDPLVASPEPLACSGSGPVLCVAEPYRHLEPDLRARLVPLVERLRAAGVDPPDELHQAFYLDLPPGVGSITADALVGEPASTRFAVRSAYESPFCRSSEEAILQGSLVMELDALLQQPPPAVPGTPPGPAGDRLAEVVAELATLCQAPASGDG